MAGSPFVLAPDAHSGRKLGKYEILCRLSTGGMSEIFLAFQKGLAGFRKFVVLKQILPDIMGEEEFVRMFLDEAKITAAFNHPNIAQVYDLDIADGELFLAMEFVPGATLVEVARACRSNREPIPIGFTLQAVRDTALALHYAHTFTDPTGKAQQVIHRDIAEKNIMVTYEGVTKLLDFGIAKALNRVSRTSVGMVKGTTGYMSPEQILGEPLDPRSDLFSLGVVLHECLTGMRLFHGKTPEQSMLAALKGDIAPPSAQNRAVSPELDLVTLKALRKNRTERCGTALEFARAIERVAAAQIWHPEQSSEFIQRLFAQRRDQTRELMSRAQGTEHTGEFRVSEFLQGDSVRTPPPPAPQRKATRTSAPVLEPRPRPPVLERGEVTEIEPPIPLLKPKRRTRPDLQRQPATVSDPIVSPSSRFASRPEPEARTVPASSLPSQVIDPPWDEDHTIPALDLRAQNLDLEPSITVSSTSQGASAAEYTLTGVDAERPRSRWLRMVVTLLVLLVMGAGFTFIQRHMILPTAAEATRPGESGTLTLLTEPEAKVFLDSRELGVTPLVRATLPAGTHALRLVGADQKPLALIVEITPGNDTELRISLDTLKPAN